MDSFGRNEWLSENAYRAFPFVEDSSFTADDGVEMPIALVRDFRCVAVPLSRSGSDFSVRLSGFRAFVSGWEAEVEVTFSVPCMSGDVDPGSPHGFSMLARIPFSGPGFAEARASWGYSGMPESDGTRAIGAMCVLGVPVSADGGAVAENLGSAFDGEWHMFSDGPRVLGTRSVFIPGGIGVDSLLMKRSESSAELDAAMGDVHVRNGRNTVFRIRNGALYLTSYAGAGEGFDCGDSGGDERCAYIHYINGQHAGTDGDFRIVGGEGVSVGSGSYNGIPGVTITTGAMVNEFAKSVNDR